MEEAIETNEFLKHHTYYVACIQKDLLVSFSIGWPPKAEAPLLLDSSRLLELYRYGSPSFRHMLPTSYIRLSISFLPLPGDHRHLLPVPPMKSRSSNAGLLVV
jgi:hypothetical protein